MRGLALSKDRHRQLDLRVVAVDVAERRDLPDSLHAQTSVAIRDHYRVVVNLHALGVVVRLVGVAEVEDVGRGLVAEADAEARLPRLPSGS